MPPLTPPMPPHPRDLRVFAICPACAEAHRPGAACPRCAGELPAVPPPRRGAVELADPWFERTATRPRTSRAPAAAFGVVVTATVALLVLALVQA